MPGNEERLRDLAARFGNNLRAVRERREMSQADLAREMAARGHSWYQSTTYKIEHGERAVSFHEVIDLAAILGVTTDRFTWTDVEALAVTQIANATGTLRQCWREAADVIARLHAARAVAERMIADHRESTYPRVRDAARGLGDELADSGLDAALTEGEAVWERTARGEA